MAKALIGHVGGQDPRTVMEVRRLHERVRSLEAEIVRLRAENDALSTRADAQLISLEVTKEPALA